MQLEGNWCETFAPARRMVIAIVAALFIAQSAPARPSKDPGQHRYRNVRADKIRNYTLTTLPAPGVTAGVPDAVSLDVPIDDVVYTLRLERHSVRAKQFDVLLQRDDGSWEPINAPAARTYRGTVDSVPGSTVAATLSGGRVCADIDLGNGRRYRIDPAARFPGVAAVAGDHLVYRLDDIDTSQLSCGSGTSGVSDLTVSGANGTAAASGGGLAPATGPTVTLADLAIDTDHEFFLLNGSSVEATIADVEEVINAVSLLYENQFAVRYEITTVLIRTSPADPYESTSAHGLLNELTVEWNFNTTLKAVHRDMVHLLTGKNMDNNTVGIANIGVVCDVCGTGFAYGLSESRFSEVLGARAHLTAHELGHNWGARHCDGDADCAIMCSDINGCTMDGTRFGSRAVADIEAERDSVGCLTQLADPLEFPFCATFDTILSNDVWAYNVNADIDSGSNNAPSPPNALHLDGCCAGCQALPAPDDIRSNFILLGGLSEATLSYHTQHVGGASSSDSQLVVEYFSDQRRWVELNRIISPGTTQTNYDSWLHELPTDARHDEFRIRFRVDGEPIVHADWYVDDLSITNVTPDSPILYVRQDVATAGLGESWATAYTDLQDALSVATCSLGVVEEIWVAGGVYKPDRGTGDRSQSFRLVSGVAIYGGFSGTETTREQRNPTVNVTTLSGDIGVPGSNSDNSFHVVQSLAADSSAVLDGFAIQDGSATSVFPNDAGGGILINGGGPAVSRCLFADNRSRRGGAMLVTGGASLTMDHCDFVGNESIQTTGGAMHVEQLSVLSLLNTRILGNQAVSFGGGVYNDGSVVNVTNGVIASNSAGRGGGLYNTGATASLNHCTFVANSATADGGGVFSMTSFASVANSIFWGNHDAGGSDETGQIDGVPPTINYSIAQGLTGSWGGDGNLADNPQFIDADGGDGLPGTLDDDLRLGIGSPGRNSGDPTEPIGSGQTDLDGVPRVLGGRSDMGAYESGVGDFDLSNSVNLADTAAWMNCVTGSSGLPYAVGCEAFDFDADLDIDLDDLTPFVPILSNPD